MLQAIPLTEEAKNAFLVNKLFKLLLAEGFYIPHLKAKMRSTMKLVPMADGT